MEPSNSIPLTFKLGGEREISRIGYGAMQLSGPGAWGDPADRDNAKRVLSAAIEAGVNFIDTAEAYGPQTNEILIKDAIKQHFHEIIVATKGGLERPGPGAMTPNGHPEFISKCIEGSLTRLEVNQIDLWQLHRVDPNVPIEETLAPVVEAVAAGKIKYVGLSEVDINSIERARKVVSIASVQNLYNLGNRSWEEIQSCYSRSC